MADNLNKVNELIEKMKAVLPISVYPTNKICHSLKNDNGVRLKPKQSLKIKDIMYMGNEGGICCAISIKNDEELLMISLTHLRIKGIHPLSKEIKKYQIKRIRALANI